jgi:hypothetical protein
MEDEPPNDPPVDWGFVFPGDDDGEYDDALFKDMMEREAFLNAVARGTPVLLAGIEVGWTPARVRKVMSDKEFASLVNEAHLVLDARIEQVIFLKARAGVEWAVKLVVFNRMKDRWKDVRHIDVTHTLDVAPHVIAAAREESRLAVRELARGGGIAELQRSIIEADEVPDEE